MTSQSELTLASPQKMCRRYSADYFASVSAMREEIFEEIFGPSSIQDSRIISAEEAEAIKLSNQEWQNLPSYVAALRLNRLYLQKKRTRTVFYNGPTDDETEQLLPMLIRLHDYCLLTHKSQPFDHGCDPSWRAVGARGWWYQFRQRPYLKFLLPRCLFPKAVVDDFCNLLLAHPKIMAKIHEQDQLVHGNLMHDQVVHKAREARTREELLSMAWYGYTRIDCQRSNDLSECHVEAIERAECLNIEVLSRSWEDELDLCQVVEDVAIAAGLTPICAEQ